ncbi:MAG: T9SS type A sorting domain-containing protein [Bacteroidales bacterium]|nr:T9SS type A sorting domain-containing protein [Bacteroidales bacterium]
MKRFLLFTGLAFFVLMAYSQQVEREMVVLEIATGTWCPYCPGSAMGADDLIENGHDVAVIEYHSGDDYQNTYATSRINYYGITGFPTAVFDGVSQVVGGSSNQSMYPQYLPRYQNRKNTPSSFTIDVEGYHYGLTEYHADITLEKVAATSSEDIVLHAALTESHIEEYWQGMDELNFVERLMIPNQYGTPVDFSGGDIQEVNLTFDMEAEWVMDNCELVVFLQDTDTKEILQGTKISLTEFPSACQLDAGILSTSHIPLTTCSGTVQPLVEFNNCGNEELTSLDVSYSVNGGEPVTAEWTGSLAYRDTATMELPLGEFTVEESNTLEVSLSNPNGQGDEFNGNDAQTQEIEQAMEVTNPIYIMLRTDNNPEETTWEILNSSGEVVHSGGPYEEPSTFVLLNDPFEFEYDDCYSFIIYDAGGNGIRNGNGMGMYYIAYGNDEEIVEGAEFGDQEETEFNLTVTSVNELAKNNKITLYPNPVQKGEAAYINIPGNENARFSIFDNTGHLLQELQAESGISQIPVSRLSAGVYVIQIVTADQVVSRKLIIE